MFDEVGVRYLCEYSKRPGAVYLLRWLDAGGMSMEGVRTEPESGDNSNVLAFKATKVGADLSTETLIKTMDNNMSFPPDIFGSAELTFSPTKRLGSNATRLSQLQDARWKVVSEYMSVK